MRNHQLVNEAITNREPCTSFEEGTYYTQDLFKEFCKNKDYKYITIFGYYKSKYRWTDQEALDMYNKAPDGWTDGLGVYRLFDWGKGDNKVISEDDRDFHEPHLDHVVPRSVAKGLGWSQKEIDSPSNMQVLPNIVNRILSNLTDETAPAVLPIVMAQFQNLSIQNPLTK